MMRLGVITPKAAKFWAELLVRAIPVLFLRDQRADRRSSEFVIIGAALAFVELLGARHPALFELLYELASV